MNSHEDSLSLAARAAQCRNEFTKLSADVQDTWARDQMAQFNMWAANIGVLAKDQQSLDFRLKDIPAMHRLIRQLLKALEEDLIGDAHLFISYHSLEACQ
jgi:hypothetical protein